MCRARNGAFSQGEPREWFEFQDERARSHVQYGAVPQIVRAGC